MIQCTTKLNKKLCPIDPTKFQEVVDTEDCKQVEEGAKLTDPEMPAVDILMNKSYFSLPTSFIKNKHANFAP